MNRFFIFWKKYLIFGPLKGRNLRKNTFAQNMKNEMILESDLCHTMGFM